MSNLTLFDLTEATPTEWGVFTQHFGKGTEYEAIVKIAVDEDNAYWGGFLVFKDKRFSPEEEDLPGMQFQYFPPGGANGAVAASRAETFWETLCQIFSSLRQDGGK